MMRNQLLLKAMRTTVDLEKRLLERAKRLALNEGRTLSGVLNRALAAYLGTANEVAADPKFVLITRGQPQGRFPSPEQIAAVEEADETASLAIPKAGRRVAP